MAPIVISVLTKGSVINARQILLMMVMGIASAVPKILILTKRLAVVNLAKISV